MEWIAMILQAFFEQTEIEPESISEIEIVPGYAPGIWYLHVQPPPSWFAEVSVCTGEWGVVLYDYL